MTQESQITQVREYLLAGNKLTPIEALNKFGSFRLASIIHLLRKEGMTIVSNMHKFNGNNYAVYEYIPLYKKEIKEPNNWIPSFDL